MNSFAAMRGGKMAMCRLARLLWTFVMLDATLVVLKKYSLAGSI